MAREDDRSTKRPTVSGRSAAGIAGRDYLRKALVLGIATLATLLVCEFGLRLLWHNPYRRESPDHLLKLRIHHPLTDHVFSLEQVEAGVIPKGTLLNVPFVHLLRDSERFPSPETFDPDRWTERPRPGTIETAMFGGGPHFCLGYHIAIAEGTLFNMLLARALDERGLELSNTAPGPVPKPVYLPLMHPPRGVTLRLVPARISGESHAHQ